MHKKTIRPLNIVCFGGGTGLSTLLSSLKRNPWLHITAIVTMFDSGGSSGKLRDEHGILPPGDIQKAIVALADQKYESFVRDIFLTRTKDGHSGGNLMLFGSEGVYQDYTTAIEQFSHLLKIRGRVLPIALTPSDLCAKTHQNTNIRKETRIDEALQAGHEIKHLTLDPPVLANPQALNAMSKADAICIGPGSFYTSILPNLLPEGIKATLTKTRAPIMFIMNLLTEGKGMRRANARTLTATLESYIGKSVDYIIVNSAQPTTNRLKTYAHKEHKFPIDYKDIMHDPRYIVAPLWTNGRYARHDPDRLSSLIYAVLFTNLTKKP